LLFACLDRKQNFVIIIGLCFLEDMEQHLATNGRDPRLVDVIHVETKSCVKSEENGENAAVVTIALS
jgi:hypothetical protein